MPFSTSTPHIINRGATAAEKQDEAKQAMGLAQYLRASSGSNEFARPVSGALCTSTLGALHAGTQMLHSNATIKSARFDESWLPRGNDPGSCLLGSFLRCRRSNGFAIADTITAVLLTTQTIVGSRCCRATRTTGKDGLTQQTCARMLWIWTSRSI